MSHSEDPKSIFAALAGSYSELTRRLARRLGHHADAQDVMQETWIRLARSEVPAQVSSPKSYVARVAGNLAIDHMRAQTRHERQFGADPEAVVADDAPSAERVLDYRQRIARLNAVIAGLPPRQREVFLMHKFDGLSHSEVASRLGISRSAVEKLVMKALASCRDGMGDLLDED
ncbi:RNA polymerase sigma factor [Xinfangfangia sp. D13-10-4-6]|uniref:RNA polymerase sigma factor n=1 Tax=Pseudogemmobacter hezensis TaxID=2737662 RepID=UPI0015571DFA|nr:RNA polymerase sigma factor [Pseudogemmobacter hezensis]NPD14902.1 RNA polymerase sigma factor [Pseudogemmobacter hezensis]